MVVSSCSEKAADFHHIYVRSVNAYITYTFKKKRMPLCCFVFLQKKSPLMYFNHTPRDMLPTFSPRATVACSHEAERDLIDSQLFCWFSEGSVQAFGVHCSFFLYYFLRQIKVVTQ